MAASDISHLPMALVLIIMTSFHFYHSGYASARKTELRGRGIVSIKRLERVLVFLTRRIFLYAEKTEEEIAQQWLSY